MTRYTLKIICCLAMVSLALWAEDAAQPTPASETGTRIREAISVNLIDLDALEKAAAARMGPDRLRVSLRDCINMALLKNDDILIASLEPEKADADLWSSKGEFDPMLRWTRDHTHASTSIGQDVAVYTQGLYASLENIRTAESAGVLGKLHLGTQYSVMFNQSKEQSTFGQFYEEYTGNVTLALTQPLLRGFGLGVNKTRIRMARNNEKIAEAQVQLTVMNTVAGVVKAYWDLVGAVENVQVRRESLENAKRLLGMNEKRRQLKTAADIDVLQAKSGVAQRQSDMVSALSQVEDASDLLKNTLGVDVEDAMYSSVAYPSESLSVEPLKEGYQPQNTPERFQEGMKRALEKRPEIFMASVQTDSAELELNRAQNDMLPEVNLKMTRLQGGRNHRQSLMIDGIQDKMDTTDSYGVEASVPVFNRAARGAYRRAKLTQDEMLQREEQARRQVRTNLQVALRKVDTNRILVESNSQSRKMQEANVMAEEKRLELGLTTSFQVMQIQEQLTAARTQELLARIAYEKALTELDLAEGVLLENLDIDFETGVKEPVTPLLKSFQPRWK